MTDFMNNLEMSLHKLGLFEQEIENIRQNQSMLDFCENVCNRQSETQLCLHRVRRLIGKAQQLQSHLAKQPVRQQDDFLRANWMKDSCKEMLIRLAEVQNSMQPNLQVIEVISQSQINVESHSDLQDSLTQLAAASTRCKEANRIILDMTFRYCQLYILGGCYGRVVHTVPLFQ